VSRPKSPERIQADIDRAIRTARRERKRKEREVKRAIRLRSQLSRERILKNGVPKVQPSESRFGLREAMDHSSLMICNRCQRAVREREIIGDLCESCHYNYFDKEK